MLSVGTAMALLRAATRFEALPPIAAALDFSPRGDPLDAQLRERIGLPSDISRACVFRGAGSLRALTLEMPDETTARAVLGRAAAALARHVPHSLWLVIAVARTGAQVIACAWSAVAGRPRLRTLSVDPHHVVASDAETLCALAAASSGPDLLVHARWLDVLGRDALTRRFYLALRETVQALADDLPRTIAARERGDLALLCLSRLMFLSFLQSKGWLNGDHCFLENAYYACTADRGGFHGRVLDPLFFGTLNTRLAAREARARAFGKIPYLNGGLFARGGIDRRHRRARFSDAALGVAFSDLLTRYRFTPREDIAEWSEAAIDPEILGKAFESLMESDARKRGGVFYTPNSLVERVTRTCLLHALSGDGISTQQVDAVLNGETLPRSSSAGFLSRVRALRVLDPACGSGAFLLQALRTIADLRVRFGDESAAHARRMVLTDSLFGVDVNPTAVWLCELRLWLALAIECDASDPMRIDPLPNLDRNIRIGDTLLGGGFGEPTMSRANRRISVLREQYSRSQGVRRRTLAAVLDRAERDAALTAIGRELVRLRGERRELVIAMRARDLFGERRRDDRLADHLKRCRREINGLLAERARIADGGALPFAFVSHFPDVTAEGGFGAIVGNPPWVRPHRIASGQRAILKARFRVMRRSVSQSESVSTPSGFGAQVDLAALFLERSITLLRPGGTLALLLPSKLWRSLAGASARQLIADRCRLVAIEDFSSNSHLFEAAAYPSLVAAGRPDEVRVATVAKQEVAVALHRRSGILTWRTPRERLGVSSDPASVWLLVPPCVRSAFDRLVLAGIPLSDSAFGTPRLGVKTGFNAAFIVELLAERNGLAEVRSEERRAWIERHVLRPIVRGELVRPWKAMPSCERIVWTHAPDGQPLAELPPHAATWLRHWRAELTARVDAGTRRKWWTLFRTPAAGNALHRVVWSDIGRQPSAVVLAAGSSLVPINTCYVAFARAERQAHALAALLNSPLAASWLRVLAEPARGGYHRYFAWTMAALPLPRDERRFVDALAPLGARGAGGDAVAPDELLLAALSAYGLRRADMAALLEWQDV